MVWLRVWCWEAKCGKGVGKSQKALLFFRYFLNNILIDIYVIRVARGGTLSIMRGVTTSSTHVDISPLNTRRPRRWTACWGKR